ncbi:MAG: IS110 family transposase [Deltaproteobacteria bacterium]|nr:IS110 family transposase [Alphaproteobacteria bacterium]MCB9789347.1 IS110 family transposase [Deltaproteobacteria bacterium]
MKFYVGIDIAKHDHWVVVLDESGKRHLSRKLTNTPEDLARLVDELRALDGERRVAIDVVGGIASLLTATLLQAGEPVVYVSGLAVNRSRDALRGGENKSDPRDAQVIADLARTRGDLRAVGVNDDVLVGLRLAVSRRRDLVVDQTRRIARLHDLLVTVHPGLEAQLDLTTKSGLLLVESFVTPSELRAAGADAVREHLVARGVQARQAEKLAQAAVTAARAQQLAIPGERFLAAQCRELATEALAVRARIRRIEQDLEELLPRTEHGAVVRSLPGMGVNLTAEFLVEVGDLDRFSGPDALAMAAGLAPVLRQSGTVRFTRRNYKGDKNLKRILYQSAFASLGHPASKAFYDRKRAEGKRHHQAVIALARRRINVLWALMRDRTPFDGEHRRPDAEAA